MCFTEVRIENGRLRNKYDEVKDDLVPHVP